MNALKDFIINTLLWMIGSFDNTVAEAQTVLTLNLFEGEVYDAMITIAGYLTPVCTTIIAICFIIEFTKMTAQMDILKWEYGLRIFAKLCIAQAAIAIAPRLMAAIYATAAEWITMVAGDGVGSGMSTIATTRLGELFDEITPLSSIALAATVLIMFVVIAVCGIVIQVIAYARMIEIFIYIAVSPIPCAFLPLEDGQGGRMTRKFFLGFAAVCLQGLIIMVVMEIFDVIVGVALSRAILEVTDTGAVGISAVCFTMLLGSLILTMAIIRSGTWAKQIIDV